jgi:hypothetical protein
MAQPTIAYRTAILVVSSLVCSYQNMLILDLMIAWISLRMSELYIPTHASTSKYRTEPLTQPLTRQCKIYEELNYLLQETMLKKLRQMLEIFTEV